MDSGKALRRGSLGGSPTRAQKLYAARLELRNWFVVGAVSRAARLLSAPVIPRALTRRIHRMSISVKPRTGFQLHTTVGNLGAVYDVFVLRDYDFDVIPWSEITTVIDCGANVGAFTIWAAARCNCRVFAVEPTPNAVQILQHNVSQLGGRARVMSAAVMGQRGTTTMFNALHEAVSSTLPWRVGWDQDIRETETTAVTIEDVFDASGFETVDLLKIDVEGAEAGIFETVSPEVLHRVRIALIEAHPAIGVDTAAIAARLRQSGMNVAIDQRETPMLVAWRP